MKRRRTSRLLLAAVLAFALSAQTGVAAAGIRVPELPFRPVLKRQEAPSRPLSGLGGPAALSAPRAAAYTATPDAYEAGSGDDAWNAGGVRDLTSAMLSLPLPGIAYVENHTIDLAQDETADEDWFRFGIDVEEIGLGYSVLIEAVSKDTSVSPIVEVFSASDVAGLTPYADLPAFPGTDPPVTGFDPDAVSAGMRDTWFAGNGAKAALFFSSSAPPATYYVRVRPYYQADHGQVGPKGFLGGAGGYQLRVKAGTGMRVAGPDRFRTSVAASKEMFANGALEGGACVVANGLNFPDALAGSTLAGAVGGPLLLTGPSRLDPYVKNEIRRLGVSTVYVLGSGAALPGGVFDSIEGMSGVTAKRVYGTDRYSTARAIAKKAYAVAGGGPTTGFVVSGANFPDALSASPMAAANVAPILLTRPDRLSSQVEETIDDLGITDVVIVGGEPAVSSAVQSRLVSILGGSSHVKRVSGKNRYATSAAFARWATDAANLDAWDGFVGTAADPDGLLALWPLEHGVASGMRFPDALAGGTTSGLAGCPVLLLDWSDAAFQGYAGFLNAVGTPQHAVYVFGGEAAIPEELMAIVEILTFPAAWE